MRAIKATHTIKKELIDVNAPSGKQEYTEVTEGCILEFTNDEENVGAIFIDTKGRLSLKALSQLRIDEPSVVLENSN